MQKKSQANLALGLTALGAIATSSSVCLLGSGVGATILHSGFLAGTIGGLADWFAVRAIFSKPLGIPYRTDILRKNRQDIMHSIVDFVMSNLLSSDNIKDMVANESMSRLLVNYITNLKGRERIKASVAPVISRALDEIDIQEMADTLAKIIENELKQIPLNDYLRSILEHMNNDEDNYHNKKILAILVHIAGNVLTTPQFRELLIDNIEHIRRAYEGDGLMRGLVLSFFDNESIANLLTIHISNFLKKLLVAGSSEEQKTLAGLKNIAIHIVEDNSLGEIIYRYQLKIIEGLDINSQLVRIIGLYTKGDKSFILDKANSLIDEAIDKFIANEGWQTECDIYLKSIIQDLASEHHEDMRSFIYDHLQRMSDDELVSFVEERVQDDLQMIRINGALVGAIVGMILSGAVFIAEGVW